MFKNVKLTKMLEIQFLDHIAIRVTNMEISAKWYEEVLGLRRFHPKEWQPFPIMLLAGNSGIALFPKGEPTVEYKEQGQVMSHFAFRVTYLILEKAKELLKDKKIPFVFEDHHYFHSIYLKDPDGNKIELTAVVKEVV